MAVRATWSCFVMLVACTVEKCYCYDPYFYTAPLGENVTFTCQVLFSNKYPMSYQIQWYKVINETELLIGTWSSNNNSNSTDENYEERVALDSTSLSLTKIRQSDQGWYECNVVDLNRSPNNSESVTRFHLDVDVHVPPQFTHIPPDLIHVYLDDVIILVCKAEGKPAPKIFWYKDYLNMVENATAKNVLYNGRELRLPNIQHEDMGDYTCIADNGKTQISHTTRVVIVEDPVIIVPSTNQTKLQGEKLLFTCKVEIEPTNITVEWFHQGVPVKDVASLSTRTRLRNDGSLTITSIDSDDSGEYSCQVSNGFGESQSESVFLTVEYPAKVTFTPTIQYLPLGLSGVIQCFTSANPPLQYVAWTKDERLFDPLRAKDIVLLNNGSLSVSRSYEDLEGNYTCTPYNIHGTQGSSRQMQVMVRQPPVFTIVPEAVYHGKIGGTIEMHCEAQEGEATQKPSIQWQRRDKSCPLPKERVKMSGGNITIEDLQYSDFGFYECLVSNDVTTITAVTHLVVNGGSPHNPRAPVGTID